MATASATGAGALDSRKPRRRGVVAAVVGNAFEWYDFTVYALFSVYIAQAFFPGGDAASGLVKAFLAFGLGFVVRPLGAIALGIYGDRVGRKAVLNLALALMVAGTAILAMAPGFAAIGVGAPLLVLAARALQGFSAGGEFGGAAAFLTEHAPAHRRGEFIAWLQGSMGVSNIMGALVAVTVTSLFTPLQMSAFAWRIPFVFGLLIAPVGLWMRRSLQETEQFISQRDEHPQSRMLDGLKDLLTHRRGVLLRGISICTLLTVSSYVLVIFMPVYVQRTFHYPAQQAFAASLVGNVLLLGSCVGGGVLSDRIGRKPVLLTSGLLLAVVTYPLLALLAHRPVFGALLAAQSVFCIVTGVFVGTAPAAVSESFPPGARTLGVSVSYNLAVTLFSGFAPAALIWISSHGGGVFAPAWYVTLAALVALPTLLLM